MKYWTLIYILIASSKAISQDNYVPNGSFDETISCGNLASIAHWFIPQKDPVDLNQLCPYIDWWRFIRDRKMGLQGSQCGFIETYYRGFADDNINSGRLYLAVKLIRPLTAGRRYYIEMMVRAVDTFPNYKLVNTVFTNGQDISFTKELPLFDFNVSRNYLSLKPVVVSSIQNNYDWYKVSQCFVADGSEHFLVIGNFRNDANTETAGTGKLNPNFPAGLIANYAIDNVVLTSMDIPIGDTALCLGDTLRLDVGKPFLPDLKYQWQDGSTAPIFKISEAKHVVLQMHYSMQCGVSRSFDVVSYNTSTQRLSTKIDTFYCQGQSIELSGGLHLSGQRLLWEDGTSRDIRTVRAPGVYIATVKADCGLMLTKQYTIKAEICNPPIYIPNVFTPNGDGINDVFKPLLSQDFPFIETLTLSIFNRWGDLIFVTHDIDAGWDGRKGGDKFPSGVYIYSLVIKTTNSGNSLIVKNGDVTLIDR